MVSEVRCAEFYGFSSIDALRVSSRHEEKTRRRLSCFRAEQPDYFLRLKVIFSRCCRALNRERSEVTIPMGMTCMVRFGLSV